MHQQEFDDEAALLLAEYGREHGDVTSPPVPVDDIMEEHLKIPIEVRDLRAEYPEGDVLGAIFFNDKLMVIDQRLIPEEFPSMRGRYRFTVAHELGHWQLHRHYYLRRASQRSLLSGATPTPDHVLRSHQSDPREVQANRFASCLLMPREMVKRAWHEWRGSMEPIYLSDLRAKQQQILAAEVLRRGDFKTCGGDAIDNTLFECVVRPLAEDFEVSPEAMRIRLEGMKLLCPKREKLLF
jgi:hypothetical protein